MDLPLLPGLSDRAAAQLENYLALLVKWNARMNLTAVREPEEIVRRHFAESIFVARKIPPNVLTVLDFGSGAGLPGIPISICRPELAVTLAESRNKKASFLREAVRTLGLRAEVWPGRVQAMPAERVFDAITLRAVDRMAAACRAAVERLAPQGWLAVFTTRNAESGLDALAGVRWLEELPLPDSCQGVLRTGTKS